MEPAISSDMVGTLPPRGASGLIERLVEADGNARRGRAERWAYPGVGRSVEGMTTDQHPVEAARRDRLPYDDPDSLAQMRDDCRGAAQRLPGTRALEAAARAAVRPAPSLHFDDFPREVAKRDTRVDEAAARLAAALHLGRD